MMSLVRLPITALTLIAFMLGWAVPVRAYTLQYDNASGIQIKWPTNTITVALSTSLNSPPSNIKAGSDLVGAANRALGRWSQAANVQFVVTSSGTQSVSPSGSFGNGMGLITVANTPENVALFQGGNSSRPARTRIFYDPNSGAITEADIVINPTILYQNQINQSDPNNGVAPGFSTDGSPWTYDVEAALAHEVGHLLGLEHSANLAATMQPRLGRNSVYNLPALTVRTLSEDDRAGVRAIYGPRGGMGSITGTVSLGGAPAYGAHVWAENAVVGKVTAGNISVSNGTYRIDNLPPGQYRVMVEYLDGPVVAAEIPSGGGAYAGLASSAQPPFHTTEAGQVSVTADATTPLNIAPPSGAPSLNPSMLGLNLQLSTSPLPLSAGGTYTIYVGGPGVDQVPASGISITSPFMTVNPASFVVVQAGPTPIISFDTTVSANVLAGDYSIRLQSNSGEVAYVAGGLTIDPGVSSSFNNAIDDPTFFVTQHYLDFLGRQPDQGGLNYWVGQLTACGSDQNCMIARRVTVSAAYFTSDEFQQTGYYVYRFYKASLGRQPAFAEFMQDKSQVVGGATLDAGKATFATNWATRAEFLQKYPRTMTADQFVDTLLQTVKATDGVDLTAQRSTLISQYDGTDSGRAAIVRAVVESQAFASAEFNPAFVIMQYFGYLRRDPDTQGYQFWLGVLNATHNPNGMTCAFITSSEYQLHFGVVATRSNASCGQ